MESKFNELAHKTLVEHHKKHHERDEASRAELAALTERIAKLESALAWAWDNLAQSKPYASDDSEYDECAVCGNPEWKHKDSCELEARKLAARAILKGE